MKHRGDETITTEPTFAPDPAFAAELSDDEVRLLLTEDPLDVLVVGWGSDLDADREMELRLARVWQDWDEAYEAQMERGWF